MPSKSSVIVTVRVPRGLHEKMKAAIDKSQDSREYGGYTVSNFVAFCISEHFEKKRRAKESSDRRKSARNNGGIPLTQEKVGAS